MIFPRTNKKSIFWGHSVQNVCAIYVSLRRYDFVLKVIENGRRDVKNNVYHASQDNVIKFWVALHPPFPNSHSDLLFSEHENQLSSTQFCIFISRSNLVEENIMYQPGCGDGGKVSGP